MTSQRLPGLALGIALAIFLSPAWAQTVSAPNYIESWRLLQLTGIAGFNGLFPVDLDGDGDQEFVVGIGNGGSWGIGDYDEGSGEYNLLWQFEDDNQSDVSYGMRLIETGNTKYLWMGFSGGRADVFDVMTRARIATLQVSTAEVMDFALADGNNDGVEDVVVLAQDRIAMFDPLTFATRIANIPTSPAAGSFAVGNVAGDARAEIVISNGNVIRVDGATPVVTPVYNRGSLLGSDVELGNLDGDAYLELVVRDFVGGNILLRSWNLDGVPAISWTKTGVGQINRSHLENLFGDATPEVTYIDVQGFHVMDTTTQTQLWTLGSNSGGTAWAVFDSDGDGEREMVFGQGHAGYSGTFQVYDFASRALEFRSNTMRGPYSAVDVADVDNDGAAEFVIFSGSSFGGGSESILSIYDARTHAIEWRSERPFLEPGALPIKILSARIANIDADPQAEIIAAGYNNNGDQILAIDGISHTIEHQWHFDPGSVPTNVDVADVDGDGDLEIAVSNVDGGSLFPGFQVYVIDPSTGNRWVSPIAGSSQSSRVQFADVGAAGNDLVAVNGVVTRVRWSDKQLVSSVGTNYVSAAAMDVRDTAAREILAGRATGVLDVLDGDSLVVRDSFTVCPGLEIRAIADHGSKTAALICGDSLIVYDLVARSVIDDIDTGNSRAGDGGSLRRFVAQGRNALLMGGDHVAEFVDSAGNRIPEIPAGGFTLHWRASANYTVGASDPDGDPLTYSITGLPALGTASWQDAAAGVLHYQANGTGKGADSVEVTVSDGAQSVSRSIAATLTNTTPLATTAALAFHWRGAQTARLVQSDPDGDPVVTRLGTMPTRGALVLLQPAAGDVRYTPAGAFLGTDTFTYDAYDGADASSPRSVQVTLTNTAPAATTTALSFHWRGAQTARVALADSDGDPATVRITSQPARGAIVLTDAAAGDVRYTPSGAFVGSDSFAYDAFDGVTASPARTVQVTLTNTPPTAPTALTRDVVIGTTVSATVAATDGDGDPLTYIVTSQPARGTLTLNAATGQFDYAPAAGTGNVTATVAASDGVSQSPGATLTFVYPVPPPSSSSSSSSGGSSSGGGKKKGGSLDVTTLLVGFALLGLSFRLRRARRLRLD